MQQRLSVAVCVCLIPRRPRRRSQDIQRRLNYPMTLVEMATDKFPFVEDIDIEAMAPVCPDSLVHDHADAWFFWFFCPV
jgi:hypothetical protein